MIYSVEFLGNFDDTAARMSHLFRVKGADIDEPSERMSNASENKQAMENAAYRAITFLPWRIGLNFRCGETKCFFECRKMVMHRLVNDSFDKPQVTDRRSRRHRNENQPRPSRVRMTHIKAVIGAMQYSHPVNAMRYDFPQVRKPGYQDVSPGKCCIMRRGSVRKLETSRDYATKRFSRDL